MAVYAMARDLAGRTPIGTHQFIVIVPDNVSKVQAFVSPNERVVLPRRITRNTLGWVIGGHNRGRLVVEFFEPSDLRAAREFFQPQQYTRWYRPDFDTEAHRVQHVVSEPLFVRRLFFLIRNYMINEEEENIPYPNFGMGYNSNSWAQTVIEIAGGKTKTDFRGADVAHGKRIPRIYFEAVCPVDPRPRLN